MHHSIPICVKMWPKKWIFLHTYTDFLTHNLPLASQSGKIVTINGNCDCCCFKYFVEVVSLSLRFTGRKLCVGLSLPLYMSFLYVIFVYINEWWIKNDPPVTCWYFTNLILLISHIIEFFTSRSILPARSVLINRSTGNWNWLDAWLSVPSKSHYRCRPERPLRHKHRENIFLHSVCCCLNKLSQSTISKWQTLVLRVLCSQWHSIGSRCAPRFVEQEIRLVNGSYVELRRTTSKSARITIVVKANVVFVTSK